MSELMTVAEMEAAYPDEWLLILEPETNEVQQLLRGWVAFHSKDRDEMYRKAIELPAPKRFATLYTGTIPEGTAVVLGPTLATPAS
jgi:hypothetical protein